jgi:tetratricopeptide (TPR) repeat protein
LARAAISVCVLCSTLALAPRTAAGVEESAAALLERAVAGHEAGRFQEARKLLERAQQGTDDPKLLAKIKLQLGVTCAILADEEKAKEAFAAALKHDRTIAPDPERHNPAVIALFKKVRGPVGRLNARSTPPGAEVELDGESVGKTPLADAVVPAGRREVTLRLDGHYAQSRTLTIPDEGEATFETTLMKKPPVLRPGTRRAAVSVILGGALMMKGGDDIAHSFALGQELSTHFGRRSSGFSLGLALRECFGSKTLIGNYGEDVPTSYFVLAVGPRLGWDIQVARAVALYVSPSLLAAYSYLRRAPANYVVDTAHAAGGEVAVDLKLIIVDRMLIYLRAIGVEVLGIFATESQIQDRVFVRYQLGLGLGVTF